MRRATDLRLGAGAPRCPALAGSCRRTIPLPEVPLDPAWAVLVESETPAGASGDWRADLSLVARQDRRVMLRHPWLAQQRASRPSLGPNALRKMEFALEAALSMGVDITTAGAALATVMSFVHGSVLAELAEAEAQRRTDLSEAQWRAAVAPYVRKIIEEGKHPQFARRVLDAEDLDSEAQFEFGLDCLLDGLAARHVPAPRPGENDP
ncbi:TetR/AcrR family transcriptional regulator C-terminal domain-containing protein [Sorangium sp. So ce1128]